MLDAKRSCLIVVDVQGKLAQLMHDKETLFKNIQILIKAAKILNIPIIWCEQVPAALGPTLPQIAELLAGCEPIAKSSFNCCANEKFNDVLKVINRKQIILCGIEAHICIYQTTIELLQKDFQVDVIVDAVSSRTPDNKQIAIERMNTEGANISCLEMALFELLKTAEHPNFKQIAQLIK